jgi:hypothetical protein
MPKTRSGGVSRAEFNRVIDRLNERGKIIQDSLDGMRRDLDIQFHRIAQLQAEIDRITRSSRS